ncbi:tetratricopeptide repeat protein [Saccharothrix texasensis]|uniref:Soluble NSF attachment protein (SNAP)-like n=1 Tax=Saccharothrix texasensis TaxID=103734 RepID=A0A3N1HH72_9PSEU|nr:tetratricopeptide repeat protein [Saccharothrix texasensis]ROP41857.1 soluble NSF attachment protein (SNAP)-like [Saccharothrix texasensis]
MVCGYLLAASFLPGRVPEVLAKVLRKAEKNSTVVRIGIEVADDSALSRLPWEALPDPVSGQPLALHRLVVVYRKVPESPIRVVPGPLRVVVAISAPTGDGGEVLDYEMELRAVLTSVHGARAGTARVEIVPFATTTAIRNAVRAEDPHVLHICARGDGNSLDLEDDEGGVRRVTAEEFLREALPAGAVPPVLALAVRRSADSPAVQGFAAHLAGHGAAAVINTEQPVGDQFTTRAFASFYADLAHDDRPDVVAALAHSRRTVHDQLAASTERRDRDLAARDHWAAVTVFAGSGSSVVFGPERSQPTVPGRAVTARRGLPDLDAVDAGEFVGRRADQRSLPKLLSRGRRGGVLLHGIGGVGKTALASELIRRTLERDPHLALATVTGVANVDSVLRKIAWALRKQLIAADQQAGRAWRATLFADNRNAPWRERLDMLREEALGAVPALLVLDNFEDNLTHGEHYEVRDEGLRAFLVEWVRATANGSLLVTSRHPFSLPDGAEGRLHRHHVGPLSFAETMKLAWSLPPLDELATDELHRIWQSVGGHPRALEYVAALLARSHGHAADITGRLHEHVRRRLGDRADAWFTQDRDLDTAIADAVTEAADDVLLDQLLAGLTSDAYSLLRRASVYRVPVGDEALLFQISRIEEWPTWVLSEAAMRDLLATGDPHAALQAMPSTPRPIVVTADPAELAKQVDLLTRSSLLATDAATERRFVHRWTASELARRWAADDDHAAALRSAHQHAAAYWLSDSADALPETDDVDKLLEARYHHLAAGDTAEAGERTKQACETLRRRGAWEQERSLLLDTVHALGPGESSVVTLLNRLGEMSGHRGDLTGALHFLHEALHTAEGLGDQLATAAAHIRIGEFQHDHEQYDEADKRYREALDIYSRLADESGIATTHYLFGQNARACGDRSSAEAHCNTALAAFRALDDRHNQATCYQLLAQLADEQGRRPIARAHYEVALALLDEIGAHSDAARLRAQRGGMTARNGDPEQAAEDYRNAFAVLQQAGEIADAAHIAEGLGELAVSRRDAEDAASWYQQALTLYNTTNDVRGIASAYYNLATAALVHHDFPTGEAHGHHALRYYTQFGDLRGIALTCGQLGTFALVRKDLDNAANYYRRALEASLELGDDQHIGGTLFNMAQLYRTSGDTDATRDALQQAQHHWARVGYERGIADAQELLDQMR